VQPGQAKKVQTALGRDATLVHRLAVAVEYAGLYITKIRREADAPDDTGYTSGPQVQLFALGLWLPYRLIGRADGCINAMLLNMLVNAAIDPFVHRVGRELQGATLQLSEQTKQFHALGSETAQVNVSPAVSTSQVMIGVVTYALAQRVFV
jgi:hypothetical protein